MKLFKNSEKDKLDNYVNPYEDINTFIVKDSYNQKKSILVVENLTQYFRKFKKTKNVFENINFEFYENERVAFLGPNGSGKTTTIATICGIYKPKSGTINYRFKYNKSPYEKISVQFQDLQFPTSLTPKDIIDFSIKLSSNPIDEKEITKAKQIFEIDKIEDTKVSKLSGGQQQRLNVFIAMVSKPKILILDEFTTGLDIAIKNRIQNYIKEFCTKYKVTLVIISHDLDTIEELAERVIILADHRIIVDAKVKDIEKKFKSTKEMIKKYIIV